jgi:hypothetical protein
VVLGVPIALDDAEPVGLVELDVLTDAEVDALLLTDVLLGELLTLGALLELDLGAVLVAAADVLVTGGTTLRREKLDTAETLEDAGRLVRALLCTAWEP